MKNMYKLIPKFGLGSTIRKTAKKIAKSSKKVTKKVRPSPAHKRVRSQDAATDKVDYSKLYSFDRPRRRRFSEKEVENPRYISDLEIELYLDKLDNLSGVSARQMLEDAKTYWTSSERKAFNKKLKQEAKDKGYLTDENIGHPSEDGSKYALWNNEETPAIKMERANFEYENIPKGEYDPNTNTIMLRTNRRYLDPHIAYHEGIHAYGATWPGRALFSDIYRKAGEYPYRSVVNTQNFRKAKVDAIRNKPKDRLELNNSSLSFKDLYNSDPDEFVAYGLTTGKKLGIKPFQKMPSVEEALKLWQDAIEIEPYLKRNVRTDAPIEDKWSLLNGTFLSYGIPTIIGGSTVATLYNESKKKHEFKQGGKFNKLNFLKNMKYEN